MNNTPYDLAVDSGGDQFPVTGSAPRLSWKSSTSDSRTTYEIQSTIDASPQPPATTEEHLYVLWPWAALKSRQHVQWRVRAVRDDSSTSDWSSWCFFEAGLQDEDWTASWISPVEPADPGYGRRPAYTLGSNFSIGGDVRSARLYATALGLYTASINGQRAGTSELSPGSTSYDRTLYAQAWDVTEAVWSGANRIEIDLSDGWYRGQVGAFRVPAGWGTVLGARAELHIELTDGTHQVVTTDSSWTSSMSATGRADLMDGQYTDLTHTSSSTSPVLLDSVQAPAIGWSPAPPVRVVSTRPASNVRELRPGVWTVDFGQNASGWIRLEDLGPDGTRTVIEYGEHLAPDGDLSTSHLDSSRPGEPARIFSQRDEVIAGPRDSVFEPRHTVHGFQYARITRDGALDPSSITMQVVNSDLDVTGTFDCSDDDLNRLHRIGEWSFLSNAVDVPTDCPTRERLAWTGDYQVFVSTATRLRDVLGFSRKWLTSVRDDQLADGRIANFSPDGRRIKNNLDDQFAMMTGSAGWGDAIVAVPWELYRAYGDEKVLTENWDAMVRWVRWTLESARTKRHHARVQEAPEAEAFEEYLWDGTFHWGEWTEPQEKDENGKPINPVQDNPMGWFMADKGEVGTAYLHRSTKTLARIAGILGHHEEAALYAEIAEHVLEAWRRAYLRPDGRTTDDTQASYVRALSFGLLPEDGRVGAVDRLVELIRAAGTHIGTGFLATGDLLPVLVDSDRSEIAYELLNQRTAPSWLYMIDRGATTVWEAWEGVDDAGNAHESLNHYSKGTVLRFLHEYTLGLRQADDSVAWRSVLIQPVPGPSLTWARGTHETPNGTISVDWRIDGDELHIEAAIPAGTTALVRLPDGLEHRVGQGAFRATSSFSAPVPALRSTN